MTEFVLRPYPMAHFGDACIHCGTPHDGIKPGPCKGDSAKAIPIAYCKLEQRWDGYEHYAVRYSDRRIETLWTHPSFHAPYFHFGHSNELTQPPRYDERLKTEVRP